MLISKRCGPAMKGGVTWDQTQGFHSGRLQRGLLRHSRCVVQRDPGCCAINPGGRTVVFSKSQVEYKMPPAKQKKKRQIRA